MKKIVQILEVTLILLLMFWLCERPAHAASYSEEDIQLIADIVMNEASTEPFDCKLGIAKVIINRYESGKYGETLRDVIFAPFQFSTSNNNGVTTEECVEAVEWALLYPNCFPSDMFWFRTGHYHSSNTKRYDYCPIGRTYFSTASDHNNFVMEDW